MSAQSTVIIDFTQTHLKVWLSVRKGRMNQLSAVDIQLIKDLPDEVIAQTLTRMLKALKPRHSQVVAVFPRANALVRHMELPAQDDAEIRNMVDLQAANQTPYSRADVVVDSVVLSKDPSGYSKVMAIIVPREVVMRYLNILKTAGVNPDHLTLSSFGIAHWADSSSGQAPQGGVSLFIDVDEESSELCFCQEWQLLSSRAVRIGLQQLSADSMEFLKEVDLTINNYNKDKIAGPITQIVLLSSTEKTAPLRQLLYDQYFIPVQCVNTLREIIVGKSFKWPRILLEAGVSITVGLSWSLKPPNQYINLIPAEVRQLRQQKERAHVLGWLAASFVFALITVSLALSLGFLKKNSVLKGFDVQVKEAKAKAGKVQAKIKQIESMKTLLKQRVIVIDVIKELYQLLPEDISLSSFTISNQKVMSLQGFTSIGSNVNNLQKAMASSAVFTNVNLEYVNKRVTQQGEVNYFKITCVIRRGSS